MELTKENYKSNHDYLSYSRISKFLKCEAAAKVNFYEPGTPAKLIGSYVDAYFSDELNQFKTEHPEIFTKSGELKSDFKNADKIIERIKSDETMMKYLSGEVQKIMTGEIDGVKFKIKMDSYKENEFISDLKVMKDFSRVWSDTFNSYTNFVEAYDYDIELALFQEIVFQNTGKKLPCYLVAITKEDPADVGVFEIPQETLDKALKIIKNNLPRIKQILNNETEPERCEKCYYCRMTKKARVLPYTLAGANGEKLKENGF
nr:MAG TPA: Putative exonuclease [Caudoviricetes sp.]